MRKLCIIPAAVILLTLYSCSADSPDPIFETERTFFSMDTAVTIKGSSSVCEKAAETIKLLDKTFDRYSKESDIYKLNCRTDAELSSDTERIISEACELSERYGSGVNIFAGDITDCWKISSDMPSVPSDTAIAKALESTRLAEFSLEEMSFADWNGSIDLGSVAKGYALDRISEELSSDECYIASMTSSVLMSGKKPDGSSFSVSLRDPGDSSKIIGTINTEACFLSTSGGYERFFEADGQKYIHIFDLETGTPSESDLISVTVMCDSGIESDFLSTLIFTEGSEQLGKYIENDRLGIVAVTNQKEIYISSNVNFELSEDCGYKIMEYRNE